MFTTTPKKERHIFYNQKLKTNFYKRFVVVFFFLMLILTYIVYQHFLFIIHNAEESMAPNIFDGDTVWFQAVDLDSDLELKATLKRGAVIALKKPGSQEPSLLRKVFDIPVFILSLGWIKLNHREVIIRRLLTYPGEKLEVKNKVIYINDQLFLPEWIIKYQDVEIFPYQVTRRDNLKTGYVEKKHVFVLNDSWDHVSDSRLFGSVRIEDIEGVLFYRHSSTEFE